MRSFSPFNFAAAFGGSEELNWSVPLETEWKNSLEQRKNSEFLRNYRILPKIRKFRLGNSEEQRIKQRI